MTSNGTKNYRYFDIGAATSRVIAYLLDNYEYRAKPPYEWRVFPCHANTIYWQTNVERAELQNAMAYAKGLGMEFVKHLAAVEKNGGIDHWHSDNSLFCYINLEKLKDPAIVAKMMPLYSERKWSKIKDPKLLPNKIEEYNEDCLKVREDWTNYVNYLISLKSSEDAAAPVVSAEDAAPPATEDINEEEIVKRIKLSILFANFNVSRYRYHFDKLKFVTEYDYGKRALQPYNDILPDLAKLAKKYGCDRFCRYLIVTLFSYLTNPKMRNPAPVYLLKQIEKTKAMQPQAIAAKLEIALKEYNARKGSFEELPDKYNPFVEKKKEQPRPVPPPPTPPTPKREETQEQPRPVLPVAPTPRGGSKVETQEQPKETDKYAAMSLDEFLAAQDAEVVKWEEERRHLAIVEQREKEERRRLATP